MSTEKESISKTVTVGIVKVKLENRPKAQNRYTLLIEHEDLPAHPFPIRHFTDEFIELLIKEAIAQSKEGQGTITSLDILKTIRSTFKLYRKPHNKQAISLEKCRLTIREKMYKLARIIEE